MDQLISAITAFIVWLQKPAIVLYALAILVGAYELLFTGGEGVSRGKKTLAIATIAFIIIKGASAISTSMGSSINF